MLPRAASPSYLFIGTNNLAYFLEAYPALRLRGWTQETTRCGLYGLPSSQARGLDSAKLLDAASYEDWNGITYIIKETTASKSAFIRKPKVVEQETW